MLNNYKLKLLEKAQEFLKNTNLNEYPGGIPAENRAKIRRKITGDLNEARSHSYNHQQ
jgi:hypothetical protein